MRAEVRTRSKKTKPSSHQPNTRAPTFFSTKTVTTTIDKMTVSRCGSWVPTMFAMNDVGPESTDFPVAMSTSGNTSAIATVSSIATKTDPHMANTSRARVRGSSRSRSWRKVSRMVTPRVGPVEPVAVDVVMATNRLSPYLNQTLGSLMAQTCSSWKLTVV